MKFSPEGIFENRIRKLYSSYNRKEAIFMKIDKVKFKWLVKAFVQNKEEYVMYLAYYLAEHPKDLELLNKAIAKFSKKGA
jgi:hypothetical protein